MRIRTPRAVVAGILGALMLGTSLVGLAVAQAGGQVRAAEVDGIPMRLYATKASAPTVIIAHGFAGSAQIMDPLARGLMRRGFTVVSYDTDGHGANPVPLRMDDAASRAATDALQERLRTVVDWASSQPEVDPDRLALLGHSMGAGAVVAYAADDAEGQISATVALSLPSADAIAPGEPALPRNLLLAVGALEPASFQTAALAGVRAAYPDAVIGAAYGNPADGTARSAVTIPGVEHIGIVFSGAASDAAADWLATGLDVPTTPGSVAPVLLWVVLALIGAGLLLVPIGGWALGIDGESATAVPGWQALLACLAAAVLASLIARLTTPLHVVMPIAVGGYVTCWFLVAGAATCLGWWLRWRHALGAPVVTGRAIGGGLLVAAIAVLALAVPGRLAWAPFALVGTRPLALLALLIAFGAYFAGDALLARDRGFGARLGLMLGSRVIAVAVILASVPLLQAPGFLMLLLPLMVLLFVFLAWYAAVVIGYRNGWLAAVLVQAIPLAALVATTFPLVASP
ncbi:MAG: alpha/beta fold hydrolase [Actinomycetales bacterium]|nr:alpha/beta fold hydrolase [Actinomycetales bacterium]